MFKFSKSLKGVVKVKECYRNEKVKRKLGCMYNGVLRNLTFSKLGLLGIALRLAFVLILSVGLSLAGEKTAKAFNETSLGTGIDPTVAGKFVAYTAGTSSYPIDDNGRGGKIVVRKLDTDRCYPEQYITSQSDDGVGSPRLVYNPVQGGYDLVYYDGRDVRVRFIRDFGSSFSLSGDSEIFSFYFAHPTYIPDVAVDQNSGDLYVVVEDTWKYINFIKVDKNFHVVDTESNVASGVLPTIGAGGDPDKHFVVIAYAKGGEIYYRISTDGGESFGNEKSVCESVGLSSCTRPKLSNIVYAPGEGYEFVIVFQALKNGKPGVAVVTMSTIGPDLLNFYNGFILPQVETSSKAFQYVGSESSSVEFYAYNGNEMEFTKYSCEFHTPSLFFNNDHCTTLNSYEGLHADTKYSYGCDDNGLILAFRPYKSNLITTVQNFTPLTNPIISGYIKDSNGYSVSGVNVTFYNKKTGWFYIIKTDSNGYYKSDVYCGWNGTVTPSKEGFSFTPSYREYNGITTNQADQNFTYKGSMCHTLSVSTSPSGGGSVSKNPNKSCYNGDSVTLTATPNSGYKFSGWGGNCSFCGSNTSCTITVSSNKSCTANFEKVNRPPNTPSVPSGPTSGYTGKSYPFSTSTTDPDGDSVTYKFDWGDGSPSSWGPGTQSHTWSSTGNFCVKVQAKDSHGKPSGMSGCHYITISKMCHTLSVSTSPSGGGSVSKNPNKSCYNGDSVTLTATPNSGYKFSGWGGNCSFCGSNTSCTITVSSNKSCTANFEKQNNPPVIDSFTASPTSGNVPLTVTFTCSAHDPDGEIAEYDIDYGDDYTDTNNNGSFIHTYNKPGSYIVTCSVKDSDGNVVSKTISLKVNKQQTKGYVLHYTFDTCDATDSSANGYDGEIQGNPQCVDGVSGEALKLDGLHDWIKVNDNISFKDFTLSMWFKTSSNKIQGLFQNSDGHASGLPGIGIVMWNSNDLEIGYRAVKGNGKCEIHAKDMDLADGNWHFLALVRNTSQDEGYLYIDGKLAGSCVDPDPDKIIPSQSYISIGKGYYYSRGNMYFKGSLDDVRIYNYALSSDNISNIYQSVNPNPPNHPLVIDSFTASPTSGNVPLTVTFTCSAHDPDGEIANYMWDFDGDGTVDMTTSLGNITYTYNNPGLFHPVVKVEGDQGEVVSSNPLTINVTNANATEATISVDNVSGSPGSFAYIPITLHNNNKYQALKLDFKYDPTYLEYDNSTHSVDSGSALKNTSFQIKAVLLEPGDIRVIVYTGLNSISLVPNGEIAVVPLYIKSNITSPKTETLSLIASGAFGENNNSEEISTVSGVLRIMEFEPGDANGNGRIDIGDLLAIEKQVLGIQDPPGNSDCNENGVRGDIGDLLCIEKKILYGPSL